MVFTQTAYFQEKFTSLELLSESVTGVEFEACSFRDCRFEDAIFDQCSFLGCNFENSAISALNPVNSRFVDTRFLESKVMGIDWTKANSLTNISFDHCQIDYSNFRLLKLPKIIVTCCEAKEVDFTGADLTEGNMNHTNFERAVFSKTILTRANLVGATNYYIDPRVNTIRKAHFSLPEALSLLTSFDIYIDSVS